MYKFTPACENESIVFGVCKRGIGQTGQILAAWLVNRRGLSNQDAIAAVKKMGKILLKF